MPSPVKDTFTPTKPPTDKDEENHSNGQEPYVALKVVYLTVILISVALVFFNWSEEIAVLILVGLVFISGMKRCVTNH